MQFLMIPPFPLDPFYGFKQQDGNMIQGIIGPGGATFGITAFECCRRGIQETGRFVDGLFITRVQQRVIVQLLPFNGARRFAGDVVYHPVYAGDLVDDAAGDSG